MTTDTLPICTLFKCYLYHICNQYYDLCDHHNIHVYVVMFIDYGFCMVIFVTKFLVEGYAFSYIRPMLNFLKLKDFPHREQW